ncbi:MAG: CcmD family protein [Thermoanaerobaculia bacterium]
MNGVQETTGGIGWVLTVNLIIWTGLFLYLLRLDRRLSKREKQP